MKVAILEISESHEECIHTQVLFLKDAGHTISLILHPKLKKQIEAYRNEVHEVFFIDFDGLGTLEKLKRQWKLLRQLKSLDLVVFNTASSSKIVRNLALLLNFHKVKCMGLLHNVKRLQSSFTQKLISTKIKKYFVLNDYLLMTKKSSKKILLESFYPIFFPTYPKMEIEKKNNMFIAIPGRIDYDRRDYDYLVKAVAKSSNIENLKFVILGKTCQKNNQGKRFLTSLREYGVENHFILFSEFISNKLYHNHLQVCDYIMPLLKKESDYLKYKISGSFNMAFGHQKVLLCHEFFSGIDDLSKNAIFYNDISLEEVLTRIDQGGSLHMIPYQNPKWNYNFQRTKYLNFINT